MSTRRPKVPRAARPAGGSGSGPRGPGRGTAGGAGSSETGGKVIRADFNGGKAQSKPAPEKAAPEKAARKPAAKAKPTPSEVRAAERNELSDAIRHPGGPPPSSADRSRRVLEEDTGAEPVPAKAFSGRMLALAVVLVTITVLLAPSVRIFIEQRSEIAALERDIAAQAERQDKLQRELARWEDPAYIQQQARDRIFYVMPGETRYLVTGAEGLSDSEEHASQAAPAALPWVDALWDSVKRAATDKPAQD